MKSQASRVRRRGGVKGEEEMVLKVDEGRERKKYKRNKNNNNNCTVCAQFSVLYTIIRM